MKQGIKLLKRKMRATRPQDFKQELTRNYPEIIFQREWPRMTANVRKYFFEQQLPAIGQQLICNYFFNRNYQELTRNLSGIIF